MNDIQVRPRLRDGNPVFQTSNTTEEVLIALIKRISEGEQLVGCEIDICLLQTPIVDLKRCNTDNLKCLFAESDRFADDSRICLKTTSPELLTQNRYGGTPRNILTFRKGSPENNWFARHLEKT